MSYELFNVDESDFREAKKGFMLKYKAKHFEVVENYIKEWETPNKTLKSLLSVMCHDKPRQRPEASRICDVIQSMRIPGEIGRLKRGRQRRQHEL